MRWWDYAVLAIAGGLGVVGLALFVLWVLQVTGIVDVLTSLGEEGIDELGIIALNGGGGWIWNREVVDAYYIFIYSVRNEAGEEALGVSGITIDLSNCEFTLMTPRSVK